MRRYSESVKADVRRRISPPHRQSVARISEELGIHVITLHKWRKSWRLQGEVVEVYCFFWTGPIVNLCGGVPPLIGAPTNEQAPHP
jgi:hypothetical protein